MRSKCTGCGCDMFFNVSSGKCAECAFRANIDFPVLNLVADARTKLLRITQKQLDDLGGMNTYERQYLWPEVDNAVLLASVKYNLANITSIDTINPKTRCCHTYEEALVNLLVPLLVERLEEADKKIAELQEFKERTLEKTERD